MTRPSALALSLVAALWASPALAGDFDLEDDKKSDAKDEGFGEVKPVATIQLKAHAYDLAECLALADRNHPNLWAARARLAYVHAQLDEAKTIPFWNFTANAQMGVLPAITGTSVYTQSTASALSPNAAQGWEPFMRVDFWGAVPIYTFGKITAGKQAAEAGVRAGEWDLERVRQLARMDVRRAYFGAMLARDMRYLTKEVRGFLDKAIEGIQTKLAKGDTTVEEMDRLRLLVYRDELVARAQETDKAEAFAMAGLRFLTGVQTSFDIPDLPLQRPDTALGPVVQYLSAARLYRPEVNQARAGVVARKALVDLARARLFPDIGLGFGASYSTAPSAVVQNNAWVIDPFNRFGWGVAVGLRWNLDLLPQAARVAQAEAQLEETRAQERLALGGIAVEVEAAHASAVEAQRREEAWARAEKRSRQWISTVQDRIDLGTLDERALTEPLRAYVNAHINHNQALMDVNVTLSELARVTGWDAVAPKG